MTPSAPSGPPPDRTPVGRQDQIDAAQQATLALAARMEAREGAARLDGHTSPRVGALYRALGDARRLAICVHLSQRQIQPGVTTTPGLLVCTDCYLSTAAQIRVDPDAVCPACGLPRLGLRGPLRPVVAAFGLIIARAVLCGTCLSREQFHLIWGYGPGSEAGA